MTSWSVASAGEIQTLELGERLGRLLQQSALILLQGDLGAGKTVFARGIARGLGVPSQVPITSPTFTLMNHYQARLDLYHFDLYRLTGPDDLVEIGFDEYVDGAGVALVEWPEKLEDSEYSGLWIRLKYCEEQLRLIEFTAQTPDYERLIVALQKSLTLAPLPRG